MSTQEYDRWYVVPAVEQTDGNGDPIAVVPKYTDRDGITGFAGNTLDPDTVGQRLQQFVDSNADVETWYVVRFYATDKTTINDIGTNGDVRQLPDSNANASHADLLNDRFDDLERDEAGWNGSFWVGSS